MKTLFILTCSQAFVKSEVLFQDSIVIGTGSKLVTYLESYDSCQACIDEIGNGRFDTICFGAGNRDNFCCNAAPSEPPHSNTFDHDPYNYNE